MSGMTLLVFALATLYWFAYYVYVTLATRQTLRVLNVTMDDEWVDDIYHAVFAIDNLDIWVRQMIVGLFQLLSVWLQ